MRHKQRIERLEQSEQQQQTVIAVVDARGKSERQVTAEVAEKQATGYSGPVIVIDM